MSSTPKKSLQGRKNKQSPQKLELLNLEDRVVPAITGTVFLDHNSNGLFDTTSSIANVGGGTVPIAVDTGVAGVTVQAFDSNNVMVASTVTGANGTYTLSPAANQPYRIEFSGLPAGYNVGPQGIGAASANTSVQFVASNNATNVNFSLFQTSQYSINNPLLVTNRYYMGDQLNGQFSTNTTIVGVLYSAGSSSQTDVASATVPTTYQFAVTASSVGTTWGLAYNEAQNDVYAAAYTKKHTGYGPNGPGAIYRIDPATGAAVLLVDLGTAAVGGNFRVGYTGDADYQVDSGNTSWDAVGKTSLGGMAVNDTGTEVYVMNLFDRRLYTIPINANGTANVAGITSVLVPLPANATGVNALIPNDRGDIRPFAVEFHNGLVYVGMVNSAESTVVVTGGVVTNPGNAAALRGYVYSFNPATNTFSARSVINESAVVDGFSFNYNRDQGSLNYGGSDNFNPWVPVFDRLGFLPDADGVTAKYPQPMLSGIAFDDSGNMILGIRDRGSDQTGKFVPSDPLNPGVLYQGVAAGDTMRATVASPTSWTMENMLFEFYNQEDFFPFHGDVSLGGVVNVRGFPSIVSTVFDPVRNPQPTLSGIRAGGFRWYDNTTGVNQKSYQLYANGDAGTFGKSGGMGDIISIDTIPPREIGNRVWRDTNGNGRQDSDEASIQGVQVLLLLDGTAIATATTDANGNYYFSEDTGTNPVDNSKIYGVNLSAAGVYALRIPIVQSALSGLTSTIANINGNTEDQRDSDFTRTGANANLAITVPASGNNVHTFDAGFVLDPGSISGFVYQDANNDGVKDPGETPIAGTTVTLQSIVGGVTTSISATTTDALGAYSFTNLPAGTYSVVETQPAPFLDGKDTAGVPGGGNALVNDQIQTITIGGGVNSVNNNFGELIPAAISGFTYFDIDNNGIFNTGAGDVAIGGTTVTLVGVNDLGTTVTQTSLTAANGSYQFLNLRPGAYSVTETQPTGFADGIDTPGTPGGGVTTTNDVISSITLTQGLTSPNNNFGELLFAQLNGFVYVDANNDGVKDPGEAPIPGTTVTLQSIVGGVTTSVGSTTTAANGFYQFINLLPGVYSVVETQPAPFLDGKDTPGAPGGGNATVNDQIQTVTLAPNSTSANNNFGELNPALISGFVYVDTNNDGVKDPGEAPIPGTTVTVVGVNDLGATITQTSLTAADGSYSFTNLRPGSYTVTETQPPVFLDGKDTAGSPGGGTAGNDVINTITLTQGLSSVNNNFGELNPASLGGFVYVDTNNDGVKNVGEAPIPGTTVTVVGVNDLGTTITQTSLTAADGSYNFTNLRPGTYTVTETQPPVFLDGKDTAGTPGGGTAGNDVISTITLTQGLNSPNNNFGELNPASLGGFVYVDTNNDGVKDPGEAPIPGTTVTVVGVNDLGTTITQTTLTAADGSYNFTGLRPGTYTVTETQPATFLDGKDTAGTPGGGTAGNDVISTITLTQGLNSPNNNFGELISASLGGFVYSDADNDGVFDPGEVAIPGTTVTVVGVTDLGTTITQTSLTAADGSYNFTGLRPGTYTVRETQPTGFLDGKDTAGTPGGGTATNTAAGNDIISNITLTPGLNSPNNNFGETEPASISGLVYVDLSNDGLFDALFGEYPIPGVTITLLQYNGVGAPPPGTTGGVLFTTLATTTTATDGTYSFDNLLPGVYYVHETQPVKFREGIDTVGSNGGNKITKNFFAAVTLAAGDAATAYNFGEQLNIPSKRAFLGSNQGAAAALNAAPAFAAPIIAANAAAPQAAALVADTTSTASTSTTTTTTPAVVATTPTAAPTVAAATTVAPATPKVFRFLGSSIAIRSSTLAATPATTDAAKDDSLATTSLASQVGTQSGITIIGANGLSTGSTTSTTTTV